MPQVIHRVAAVAVGIVARGYSIEHGSRCFDTGSLQSTVGILHLIHATKVSADTQDGGISSAGQHKRLTGREDGRGVDNDVTVFLSPLAKQCRKLPTAHNPMGAAVAVSSRQQVKVLAKARINGILERNAVV